MSETMDTEGVPSNDSVEDRTLVMERVFRATPAEVFRAWTDPEMVTQWWGPEGMGIPECDLDARAGGAWRAVMAADAGNPLTVSGVFRELSPPDRLVMSWAWQQPDGSRGHETEIVVTFEDVPEGTRLKLVQSLFQDAESRNNHNWGWTSSFNDLDKLIG